MSNKKAFGFKITNHNQIEKLSREPEFVSQNSGILGKVSRSTLSLSGYRPGNDIGNIETYRRIAKNPIASRAVDDIVNEFVFSRDDRTPINIDVSKISNDILDENDKERIYEEFYNILSLLDFNTKGYDLIKDWYVDGKLSLYLAIDKKNPQNGIRRIDKLDSRYVRKIVSEKDVTDKDTGVVVVKERNIHYEYTRGNSFNEKTSIIAEDSICYVTSGMIDPDTRLPISHLEKAIKPVNQLTYMTDSLIVYRLSRAPERLIFKIGVGNMTKSQAEAHVRKVAEAYSSNLEYNPSTGSINDTSNHLAMTSNFHLPVTSRGEGTEIEQLPGGQNLGDIEDILFLRRELYNALNVPLGRLEPETSFSLGRSSEITRDEIKFQQFITRLRKQFNSLFYDLLMKQLILKNYITPSIWASIKNDIFFIYESSNKFAELHTLEMLSDRIQLADQYGSYVGKYFSNEFIQRKIFGMTEEEVEYEKEQIQKEIKSGEIKPEEDEE